MPNVPLLSLTKNGLYCEAGDFYIDPWEPVDRAVITHAHSDHARHDSKHYLANTGSERLLRTRLGQNISIQTLDYGEPLKFSDATITLFPAGHILGSAQVRVESRGEVWVVSGDYKLGPDRTCAPFEPVPCDTFISEATFGLPIYRWPASEAVFEQINQWWRINQARGKASVLFCYALGKAQRVLAGVDSTIGPIFTHGAVERVTQDYRQSGIALPSTTIAGIAPHKTDWSKALILAPPSAAGTPWLRRFGAVSTGFASGWMAVRGMRRRKAVDRGFVLSDHTDWTGLHTAIAASGASNVLVTHGYVAVMVRYLSEQGLNASAIPTQFEGEQEDRDEDEDEFAGHVESTAGLGLRDDITSPEAREK